MSDFDKQQTPGVSAEKKKMAVAGTLGALLLTIGAFHFLKATPKTASASVVNDASAAAGLILPDETAAQAQAALQQDPTAKLLRGSQDDDHAFDALPRNPFRIASDWESNLVKPDEPAPTATAQHTDYAVPTTLIPKAVDTTSLKLTGVFHQGQHLYAIINGDIYTTGMSVDTAKIVDITSNQVTFQRADSPNGPKATLTIEPKLK